jgi:glyoxylase-like metal-dependent hydrolase (beta-lactamase superfamily II)
MRFHVMAALALASVLAFQARGNELAHGDDHDHGGPVQLAQAAPGAAPVLAPPAVREISKIAGELYRFRNNNHYSVFAVTPAGIIATDPIDAAAAEWLKAELKQRFNQPVRYLVYSHDHRDHIAGGQVFADTAIVVAHENAKTAIVNEKRPTAAPNLTFNERMVVELGGTVVELIYTGRNHSDNSIVMHFPKERVLFAVDFIPVNAVAFRDFPDAYMPDWIDSLKRVEAMDFDVLAPGHGPLGKKEDVRKFRDYLEDLRGQVTRLAREGKSVEETKQLINLSKYESWGSYKDFAPLNVEGMYRLVQANRRGN